MLFYFCLEGCDKTKEDQTQPLQILSEGFDPTYTYSRLVMIREYSVFFDYRTVPTAKEFLAL